MAGVQILGADGQPMRRPTPSRASMLAGERSFVPYDGADDFNSHTENWRPPLWSPDGQTNLWRDRLVARSRDLALNDGWASGTVTRILDNTLGASFRPISKPDHRALAAYSGNAKFDAVWADEFGRAVDAKWREWADDHVGRYCDAQRNSWLGLMFGVAFRHLLIDNDCLAVLKWLPGRVGKGRARYATAVQLVDPDRLSNPQLNFDQRTMRGGVEIDDEGAAIAYHIRKAHQGDWWAASDSVTWERIDRETHWGRPVVVHFWEPERATEHRGGAGIFAPVIQRARMLFKYDQAELDGALINAVIAAIAESPFDPELMKDALEGDEDALDGMNNYQDGRREFHNDRKINIGNARVITAYPGETLKIVKPDRPNPNFAPFMKAALRNMSQAAGVASQWVTGDYSDTNYSSMRAALLDAWKTIHRRRSNFGAGFASPIRCGWLEESMEVDDLPLPRGAPEYIECRVAYSRCKWMGPGRGWVDPVADREGALLGMDAGLTTLEHEAAEGSGENYEDILDQRQVEVEGFKRRGLRVPEWGGGESADDTIRKPEVE